MPEPGTVQILPIAGLPELRPGDDLAELVCDAAPWLLDDDILVVTSKAVSKVEGRLIPTPIDPVGREAARQHAIEAETARVVAQRGATRIVVTHHGWVMAAAGVDASNTACGELALLPRDPDESAQTLRTAIDARSGVRVAIVISDTMGRPWRRGLTDNAIGVAGMGAIADLRGMPDASGVPLEVTEIAVADELAAAADLVKGKLSGVPVAVIRGLRPPADDGQGSAALRRSGDEDMFSLGTRDVVGTRRPATEFGPGTVPSAVLRSSIQAAQRATGTGGQLELIADFHAYRSQHGATATPNNLAARLVGLASAAVLPVVAEDADDEAVTRVGMAIAALLVQLHAEGLSAEWLSPADLVSAGFDVAVLRERMPARLTPNLRSHGLVVVGAPPAVR